MGVFGRGNNRMRASDRRARWPFAPGDLGATRDPAGSITV